MERCDSYFMELRCCLVKDHDGSHEAHSGRIAWTDDSPGTRRVPDVPTNFSLRKKNDKNKA